jgi:spoIIIJ-associated protein
VKDELYSGGSVAEALAAASEALGLPAERLRHHVLDPGGGGRNAQVVVMAETVETVRRAAGAPHQQPPRDPRQGIGEIVRALGQASGLELRVEIREEGQDLELRLSGPGRSLLLDRGARGFKALEHVIQRGFRRALAPGRLSLECEGYRERRDEELRSLAQELAAAVRQDGREHTAPPLNSYERRLVHLALTEEAGLETFSRGEGAKRRLVIAPTQATPPPAGPDAAPE